MMSASNPLFMWENKASMDRCALNQKEYENEEIYDYTIRRPYNTQVPNTLVNDYPNLHIRDGYGVNSNLVTKMNLTSTHGREKQCLHSRIFQAGPYLGRGALVPDVETELKFGSDVNCQRDTSKTITEVDFNRFQILQTDCMKPDLMLAPTGLNSRELWRQQSNKFC